MSKNNRVSLDRETDMTPDVNPSGGRTGAARASLVDLKGF